MNGAQVRELRQSLKMEPTHFAQLVGVHPSTLYRWEAAGEMAIRVEPFQQQIMAVLKQQTGSPQSKASEGIGDAIVKALLVGGAMFGLYKLLEAAFSEDQPRRTGGVVVRGAVPRKRSLSPRKRSS